MLPSHYHVRNEAEPFEVESIMRLVDHQYLYPLNITFESQYSFNQNYCLKSLSIIIYDICKMFIKNVAFFSHVSYFASRLGRVTKTDKDKLVSSFIRRKKREKKKKRGGDK